MNISAVSNEVWVWALHLDHTYQVVLAIAALLILWATVVIVAVLFRALALTAGRAFDSTQEAIQEFAERAADAVCVAAGNVTREAGAMLRMVLWLALCPVTLAGSVAWEALGGVLDRWAQARERELELKALWKQSYRREFRSFRAFLRFFESGGYDSSSPKFEDDAPKTPEEVFAEACELLGLPPDGAFTKKQMDENYRELVQRYHPDKPGGSNEMTACLNAARETIRNMKGWR